MADYSIWPTTQSSVGGLNTALSGFGQTPTNPLQSFNPLNTAGIAGLNINALGTAGSLNAGGSILGASGSLPKWGQSANEGMLGGTGLGMNMPTLQLGMQGVGALANLWMANKSMKLANEQFNFTKETTNTNLNNQLKTYNSSLEDRLRTRGQFNGDDPSEAVSEYERKKLTR